MSIHPCSSLRKNSRLLDSNRHTLQGSTTHLLLLLLSTPLLSFLHLQQRQQAVNCQQLPLHNNNTQQQHQQHPPKYPPNRMHSIILKVFVWSRKTVSHSILRKSVRNNRLIFNILFLNIYILLDDHPPPAYDEVAQPPRAPQNYYGDNNNHGYTNPSAPLLPSSGPPVTSYATIPPATPYTPGSPRSTCTVRGHCTCRFGIWRR